MAEHKAGDYGRHWAPIYDEFFAQALADTGDAVDFLAGLADTARVLELAIGTGRIAVPLKAKGVRVEGVDASPEMVAQLRAKPGGDSIPVTISNFREVAVDGRFGLIYLVFNTLFALLAQDEQVRCFQSVADHLEEDGAFVVECFVPDLTRFSRNQRVEALRMTAEQVYLDASIHDPVAQRISAQHIWLSERGTRLFPVELRYAWPSELDLMAQIAGLRLRERWGGWRREPFAQTSGKHVSVYVPASGRFAPGEPI